MVQKTILMMLLIIGMLNSFTSCKKNVDNTYFESYSYINNSNHNIQVKCYYTLSDQRESMFLIEKGAKLELKQEIVFGRVDSLIINADSVKIIFDGNKSIIYHENNTSEYNIINRRNYISHEVSDNETNYSYEFKTEDYNQAE